MGTTSKHPRPNEEVVEGFGRSPLETTCKKLVCTLKLAFTSLQRLNLDVEPHRLPQQWHHGVKMGENGRITERKEKYRFLLYPLCSKGWFDSKSSKHQNHPRSQIFNGSHSNSVSTRDFLALPNSSSPPVLLQSFWPFQA